MNRETTQPFCYASMSDVQVALLAQIRRYRRACKEVAAGAFVINNGTGLQAPKPAAVDKRMAQLELMRDQVVLLKNMSAQLLMKFVGNAKANALREEVEALAAEIEARQRSLHDALSDRIEAVVDRTVVNRNNALVREIEAVLGPRAFRKMTPSYLSGAIQIPTGGTTLADVAYIRIDRLKGPDGFTHQQYFVMTAHPRASRDDSGRKIPQMFISVSPEFRTPAKVHWLANANEPKDLRQIVVDLMTRDGVLGAARTRGIPIDPALIKFAHANVKSTRVQQNVITIKVRNPKIIDRTGQELVAELVSIVRGVDPKNKDIPRTKINRDNGTIQIIFSLPGKLRGRMVDGDVLVRIQRLLALSPDEVTRVKTALEDPE